MAPRPLPDIPALSKQETATSLAPEGTTGHDNENRFTIADYDYDHGETQELDHPPASQRVVKGWGRWAEEGEAEGSGVVQSKTQAGLTTYMNGWKGDKSGVSDTGLSQSGTPLPQAGLRLHQSDIYPRPAFITQPSDYVESQDLHLTPQVSLPTTPTLFNPGAVDTEAMRQDEEDQKQAWAHEEEEEDPEGSSSWNTTKKETFSATPQAVAVEPSRTRLILASIQKIIPSSIYCRLLVLTVLLETCIDLAIEGNMLWRFNLDVGSSDSTELELENKRRLPVYLCIFGLAHLFQLVLTVDAIRTRNTIQVVGLAIFNGMFLIFAGIQISEIRNILGSNTSNATGPETSLLTLPLNVLTAVIIGIIAVSELIVIVLTWFIWREFGWKIYRFLGADIRIKKYYFQYQVFECICRFSSFFFAGFGIQFIFLVLSKNDPEFIATCVAFPISLLILVIGVLGAKHENKWMMSSFLLGLIAASAYFIYKLVRIWQLRHTTYANIAVSLTVFSVLSLTCLVLCALWGVIVWRNFNKGLKEHLVKPKPMDQVSSNHSSPISSYPMQSGVGSSSSQKRITIE